MEPANPTTSIQAAQSAAGENVADSVERLDSESTALHEVITRHERTIADLNATIAHLERAQRIENVLRDCDVIDLPSARLLTSAALADAAAPTQHDVLAAVTNLRRDRPWLFAKGPQRAAPNRSSPSTACLDDTLGVHGRRREQAAHDARQKPGNRAALLRYLRLRRA